MSPDEPSEADLTDFIDGRLDDERRAVIERWLGENPDRAADIERQRQLNVALRGLGADILHEPVPERLREVLRRLSGRSAASDGDETARDEPPSGRRWPSGGPIGVIALVLVGVAVGWIIRSALDPRETAFDALLADASYAASFYSQDKDYPSQLPPDEISAFAAASSEQRDVRTRDRSARPRRSRLSLPRRADSRRSAAR